MARVLDIEVFRTSVGSRAEAQRITDLLLTRFPELKINFDLDDCDRVLRIESGDRLPLADIIETVRQTGHSIQILD
ncbi:MAG: hypothetical protein ACOYXA_07335 [Bacteroidota bacterium]